MKFTMEALIGDRYDSTDSLSKDEIHNWLLNIQKNDILKVESEDDYWEEDFWDYDESSGWDDVEQSTLSSMFLSDQVKMSEKWRFTG